MPAPATPAQLWARLVLAIAMVVAAVWIGSAFVPAILWAAVVATAVEPLRLRLLHRWPGRSTLIAASITLAVVLILVVPLVIAITRAIAEVDGITAWINGARAHGVPVAAWVANLPVGSTQLSAWWTNHLSTPQGAAEQIAQLDMGTIIEQSKSIGHNIVERAVVFAFTVLVLSLSSATMMRLAHRSRARLTVRSVMRVGASDVRSPCRCAGLWMEWSCLVLPKVWSWR